MHDCAESVADPSAGVAPPGRMSAYRARATSIEQDFASLLRELWNARSVAAAHGWLPPYRTGRTRHCPTGTC